MRPGPSKQFDREAVLEKGMELFWEKGYEATSLSELLGVMGIGRQSLYDTFGDKRSLFLEALNHYFRTRVGPALAQLRAPGSPMGNLKEVFRMLEKRIVEDDCRGCFIGNCTAELAVRDPEIARRMAGYLRTFEEAFEDNLNRAQKAGEISPKAKPRDLARALVNMIQGVALLSKVIRDPGMARSVLNSGTALLEAS